ncbi:MAG: hypothetical protein Ct9H90mP7_3980 [Candidatus Neomarinimicrobiota bacterium]|nr:MAG: hypothetical protein Ct9H90mP7_3980 [Candidatus Neomarinimicrobiota bacterium]
MLIQKSSSHAANASSPAPIYFPTASRERGKGWLIDGGIATNNPSLIGMLRQKNYSPLKIKVLGFGAGLNKRKIREKIQEIGVL